ncbi:sulfate/molybdate ABC transporter ATP-binding protein [Amycolatopsis minnesotensis]|uniref:ATP-binding cassette domain-containing protein n=1 Tax=Amycolatopsis minnesotensis TaxID=337894 RepID=A0ABN2Q0V8_9PSEU
MTGLRVDIAVRRGEFELDAGFEVPAGGVLAVLGPNGSGKSTVLACLAGLLRPGRGEVVLAGRRLTGDGVHVPPHRRRVGLLAQDPLLFPHLSVVDNVAFAPKAKGVPTRQAREVAARWLSEVDAAGLADRKPAQLSGGQAQRVAIARALAGEPDLLLLDEPFAALDVDAAPAIRALLRRILRDGDRATVLVTHDPLDALTLADTVLVLSGGDVVERGPTKEVLSAPRTAFTARIAGLNLISGTAVPEGLRAEDGTVIAGMLAAETVAGQPAVAVFAPNAVAVYAGRAHGSPRNTIEAEVSALEPHGPVVRLRAGAFTADLTPAAVADLGLEPGVVVRLAVKATTVAVHPAPAAVGSAP